MTEVQLDYARLAEIASKQGPGFRSADPFPFIVIDDFLSPADAEGVLGEFDQTQAGWAHYHHYNEKKLAITSTADMGPHTQRVFEALQARRFVDWVEELSGVEELLSDPELDGAGMHQTLPGGFLNVHTDFLSHPRKNTWSRQINLLLYFNHAWQADWNGNLELWDDDMSRCVQSIEPVFNRAVLFRTRDRSFHGHPHPLSCPSERSRKSLALYYFRDEGSTQRVGSTHYRATPDDSAAKRVLVTADRWALRAYAFIKRHTGLSDETVSRFLRRF